MTDPTHDEFQGQAVELAHAHGWRHLHVRRTRGKGRAWTTSTNVRGWPDLTLWHPRLGGVGALEIKTPGDLRAARDSGRLAEQEAMLRSLFDSLRFDFAAIVVPADWPWIEAVLDRRAWSSMWTPPLPTGIVDHLMLVREVEPF